MDLCGSPPNHLATPPRKRMKSALNSQVSQSKVLILSASVGAGHTRAARALECAFLETGAVHEVRYLDTLEYTTTVLRAVYSKAYSYAARHLPTVTGWLYNAFDRPWRDAPLRLAFNRLNSR